MKTQIIKFREQEVVNVCDMTFPEFIAFCSCIKMAERSKCQKTRELVRGLHWTSSCWCYDWDAKTVSLLALTWEHIWMLVAVLADECHILSGLPMNHWYRNQPPCSFDNLNNILEALGELMEARVGL